VKLVERDVIVVKQKAKLVELTNQYKLFDADGAEVGSVEEVGQSKAKKALRFLSNVDQFLTHKLEVREADGSVAFVITRPAKLMKSKIEVSDGSGNAVGRIVQQNMIGKIRFGLEDASGTAVGEIRGENWRAWDFAVVDAADQEIGRISKKWAGLGKEMFTTADSYSVEIKPEATGAARSLLVAAGVAVDTALKQDDK
jgi:uncharacterized protein YxjI